MRVMSAGDGYRYLLKSVAAADGDRAMSTPLTRYYLEEGTPPGRWTGAGLPAFGRGDLKVGARVTEEQLHRLMGLGRDPLSGASLGRAYPVYGQSAVPETLSGTGGEASSDGASEAVPRRRRAVAGYDFTFSVPKSASVLWAVADAGTQAAIVAEHHAAVADVLAFMEREVAATRAGVDAGDGAVAQVPVMGLVATAFDHFDSRAGDPHLHTHVVVSSKVRAVLDGRWRSLDGRPLHAATVALSEMHEALFADRLTRRLGLGWERRERGASRNPGWSIAAVPEALVAEFSSRSRSIDAETDRLVAEHVETHGRRPSRAAVIRLRQQATLSTRPEKHVRPLADLTADWRARAAPLLGQDPTAWTTALPYEESVLLSAADVAPETGAGIGLVVVDRVGEQRSTWRHWNLHTEAARQTAGWRFASATDREQVLAAVVAEAQRVSVRLTPPEIASTPDEFRRTDGSSVFRPRHSALYSSTRVLAAEERLLALAEDTTGPIAPTVVSVTSRRVAMPRVSGEQFAAVNTIVSSGYVLDLLVGPAGAGKTTTMRALRGVWEATYGPGSVIGLAPSAIAAEVLGAELGIATENTAMWLQQLRAGRASFTAGQLVVIDEATLAGTATLDRISQAAAAAGAKVLLIGDPGQLSAVEAGGAFALLAEARRDVAALTEVRRFSNEWEAAASLQLRGGLDAGIDEYVAHDRVHGGTADAMVEDAYDAWAFDVATGRVSVLVASDSTTVLALNQRARADRVLNDRVDAAREVDLHDGTRASRGDIIVTRRNDRRLRTRHGWVRNGDRWTVLAVRSDGALSVRAVGARWGSRVDLPAAYVRGQVELGYAVTTIRAQGLTVDTGHAVVTKATTREQLYVALTRGRHTNTAHVAIDRPDDDHSTRHPADEPMTSARAVLAGVLQHLGGEASAHHTIASERDAWGSIAQLAAEYETIAAAAQRPRWTALIQAAGLDPSTANAVITSEAFGPLSSAFRRAEADGHNIARVLPKLIRLRGFENAADAAAVLHARLERLTALTPNHRGPADAYIVGLIPRAVGPMTDVMRVALEDRITLIEQRAARVLIEADANQVRWLLDVTGGASIHEGPSAVVQGALTIAAFRDRYFDGERLEHSSSARRAPSAADVATMKRALVAVHRAAYQPHAGDTVSASSERPSVQPMSFGWG
jgi:conjugative relaxase-like TrwC/TraI family protein